LAFRIDKTTHLVSQVARCFGNRFSMPRYVGENQPRKDTASANRNVMHITATRFAAIRLAIHEDLQAWRKSFIFDGAITAPYVHALQHVFRGTAARNRHTRLVAGATTKTIN
jgi:hypothetical protein